MRALKAEKKKSYEMCTLRVRMYACAESSGERENILGKNKRASAHDLMLMK